MDSLTGDARDESVSAVTSVEELSRLRALWNALVESDSRHSVFLRHEWLQNAFAFFAADHEPYTILVRDGDTMIGALPLMKYVDRWRGVPVTTLAFPTDPITMNVQSDLVTGGASATGVLARVGEFLADRRSEWDFCVLDAVPEDSPFLMLEDGLLAPGVSICSKELSWVLHCLDVEGDWDSYFNSHSHHSRQHLRQDARKLQKLGEIKTEFLSRPDDAERAVETFFQIEQVVAKRSRDNYTPLDDELKSLYRRLFGDLANAGLAYIAVMKIDGRPAVCSLVVRHSGVLYTLNDVYDPEFTRGYPGHGLRGAIVREGWATGARRIDFNGYGRHIERWKTRGRKFYRLELFSPSRKGQILRSYRHRFVPLLKRILPTSSSSQDAQAKLGDRGIK